MNTSFLDLSNITTQDLTEKICISKEDYVNKLQDYGQDVDIKFKLVFWGLIILQILRYFGYKFVMLKYKKKKISEERALHYLDLLEIFDFCCYPLLVFSAFYLFALF